MGQACLFDLPTSSRYADEASGYRQIWGMHVRSITIITARSWESAIPYTAQTIHPAGQVLPIAVAYLGSVAVCFTVVQPPSKDSLAE